MNGKKFGKSYEGFVAFNNVIKKGKNAIYVLLDYIVVENKGYKNNER